MVNREFITYDDKLLSALSYYILKEKFVNYQTVVLILNDFADFDKFKHCFLEIKKIFKNNLDEIENFFIYFSLDKKISFESLIDLTNLIKILNFNNKSKIFITIQKSFENLEIPLKIQSFLIYKYVNFENLITKLIDLGYKRVNYVESIGEFAVRGEIFDIWLNGFIYDNNNNITYKSIPIRLILEENNIKNIKQFDIASQKSIKILNYSKIEFYPVSFTKFGDKLNLKDLISNNSIYIYFTDEEKINNFNDYHSTFRYFSNLDLCKKDLKTLSSSGYTIFVCYNYEYEYKKLQETFKDIRNINFVKCELQQGFYNSKEKIYLTTYFEIFTKYDYYSYFKEPTYHSLRLENIWEIQPQDYVVHVDFGIAKFLGLKKITIGDKTTEFLVLNFGGNTKLYVPLSEFDKVEKYISLTNRVPKLSKINNLAWQKTKIKIKDSLKEFISELYNIYLKRKQLKGIKHPHDSELEKLLEESFQYEETLDQLKAIEDVKNDMVADYPMDRVIVGDVGFGKTEVALRAAFRCVIGSRQVLLLTPTTILAEQHYRTFTDRLEVFGIKIGIVTRLQPKRIIEETLKKLANGEIDIIIGTHILLSDKVKFFDLGLVIIDEEHKFGVKQKEKIRLKYKVTNVNFYNQEIPDVLSLTATPIPRTLAFALEGIKDISVIETPPEGRLPVETYVIPYNEQIILSAISRELHRDGQVYYIFNDINLIEYKTKQLQKYFPNVEIDFIHSKLSSKKIEDTMMKFIDKKIKILVTTTIIEAGLDIPQVNTMIVEKAERFGLSQLYQLRGRVGRRSTKAYCYFLYSLDSLTPNAKKRLSSLLEFSLLGSGYRLALRDLEIRGAGEVLGTKQHGFVNEIGLSMYSKIIQELIGELSSSLKYQKISPKIELEIDCYIPEEYISDAETRISFYKKLLEQEDFNNLNSIIEEMKDRFGNKEYLPLKNLFLLSYLRIFLKQNKIVKIYSKDKIIFLKFADKNLLRDKLNLWKVNFSERKFAQSDLDTICFELENLNLEDLINIFKNKI